MSEQAGNGQLLQRMNRLKVLNFIRRNPNVPRPMIAEKTGLSLASITNITAYLLGKDLLEECGVERAERVGRKSTLLRFLPRKYGLICVSLSEGAARVAYTDLAGDMLESRALDAAASSDALIERIREQVVSLLRTFGGERTLAVCVTFSGMILDESRSIFSSSIRWTGNFRIKEELEKSTGLPTFVINNSLLKAVWYFCCNAFPAEDNMLFVDLENGIGAVQFYNGAISRAVLGEIGHTTVEKDGDPCFCGNRGCLEIMCSPERVVRLYGQSSGKSGLTLAETAQRLRQGDTAARDAVTSCAEYLGIGLANLVNLLHPSVMVLNPGEFAVCRELTELAVRECRRRAFPALTQRLCVRETAVGETDVLRGAAFEVCDRIFDLAYEGQLL